jgi:hypothetical protein
MVWCLLVTQRREIIPEVSALRLHARTISIPSAIFAFNEPVELVCGSTNSSLHVLTKGRRMDTGLGCEVGFGQL